MQDDGSPQTDAPGAAQAKRSGSKDGVGSSSASGTTQGEASGAVQDTSSASSASDAAQAEDDGLQARGQAQAETSDAAQDSAVSSGAPSASQADHGGSQGASAAGSARSADLASAGSSQTESAATIEVTVRVDARNAHARNSAYPSSLGEGTVKLQEGATAYDALVALGVAVGGNSTYVSSIGGLAEKQCGTASGWMYSVDGVFPDMSAGKYRLSGGETVVWAYTCVKGDL